MTQPLVLWSTPRSVSTAFDKMMRSRGDHHVMTEPFSVPFCFGSDRRSDRFAHDPRQADGTTYGQVWSDLDRAAAAGPVFVKAMPHHLGPQLTAANLARFHNTFLIRDPARAVPSFLAKWPDVTDEELGYEAQHRAFDLVRGAGLDDGPGAAAPVVIDATDLRAEPDRVVAAWCRAVGIEHRAETLRWEPGMPQDWDLWADWFGRAAASTGFAPPESGPPPAVDEATAERIARARVHYEALHVHRLTPSPGPAR